MQDLAVVREAEDIGLRLNLSKSEIITWDLTTLGTLLTSLPDAQVVDSVNATFLGSLLGDDKCVSRAIQYLLRTALSLLSVKESSRV